MDIGSAVVLECSVQYSQDFPVMWVKKGDKNLQDFPISNGPGLIVRDSRYSLRHDTGSSSYALQVRRFVYTYSSDVMVYLLTNYLRVQSDLSKVFMKLLEISYVRRSRLKIIFLYILIKDFLFVFVFNMFSTLRTRINYLNR